MIGGINALLRVVAKETLQLDAIMVSSEFADRKHKKLVLFDVDGTLTPARRVSQKHYSRVHASIGLSRICSLLHRR